MVMVKIIGWIPIIEDCVEKDMEGELTTEIM